MITSTHTDSLDAFLTQLRDDLGVDDLAEVADNLEDDAITFFNRNYR